MLINTSLSYGRISIGLHWFMALVIFAMFALGVWMTDLDYYHSWYHRAPELHKSVGMLLLFLLVFRFCWRLANARPQLLGLCWEKIIALAVHRLHYVLMFTVMLSGYLIPTAEGIGIDIFGWFTIPASFTFDKQQADLIGIIHRLSAWGMIGLAGLHSAAALKHHFVDRDITLLRMLGITHNQGDQP
ncbi:MAG: cytochrome b [Mariprofundaceae bacterium]